jgi:hypothetical protein
MQETSPGLFWIGRWYPRSQYVTQQQNAAMAFSLTPPSILNSTTFKPMKMQFNRSSPSFSRYKVLKLIQMLEHRKNRHIQRKFGIWCLDKKNEGWFKERNKMWGYTKWEMSSEGTCAAACYKIAVISNGQTKCEVLGPWGRAVSQRVRDAKEATKNAANFLTQCHQPTIIDSSAVFLKICLFVFSN